MDKVEKVDYGANGEIISCAMNPRLSQSSKISDSNQSEDKIEEMKKWVRYPIIHTDNSELS